MTVALPCRSVSGTDMPCWRNSRNRASHSGFAVVSMPPSPTVRTFRGWKEKQTMSPCGRPILRPGPVQADLGADGAGGVLDHRQAVGARDRQDGREVAGHAHLVDDEDRAACAG